LPTRLPELLPGQQKQFKAAEITMTKRVVVAKSRENGSLERSSDLRPYDFVIQVLERRQPCAPDARRAVTHAVIKACAPGTSRFASGISRRSGQLRSIRENKLRSYCSAARAESRKWPLPVKACSRSSAQAMPAAPCANPASHLR